MHLFDLHCDTATAAFDSGKGIGGFSLPLAAPPYEKYVQTMAVFLHDRYEGDFDARCLSVLDYVAADPLFGVNFRPLLSVENCGFCSADGAFFNQLFSRGVRLCSFSWNADNPLCGGVKGTGIGLTEKGKAALANCEKLGIAVDVSHCSDAAFEDFCRCAAKPFIASHSNCREVCDSPRNLTDPQIKQIIARGGLIGINFYKAFLGGDCGISAALAHMEHIFSLGGENVAAIGSDYDGADIDSSLADGTGLYNACRERFGARLADAVFYDNAARFFADNTDFVA